ncbi:hypothetical protein A1O1_01480 [Capronia coronata CBS 617.96]|uniref:LIM zinc-binding domain-containing protein n=1 Tax=Capronia coronata CBS 617.96 TaxID=1182541 RepID=W9ZPH7_9EURO|nr:uncharacterized protein A1O1_01480 [Capronia coronata CBS 617.96]EXJ96354.1 hypothetical protein A1O1_01480 [Capronia coronata CBS 617.96]
MVSPVSASSGSRPPWPTKRKGSVPGPRRPPSPELSNLDCAFPPFPLPPKASTTRRRDRSITQGNEGQRSRSRTAPRLPQQDSLSIPLIRAESLNSVSELTNHKQQDVISRGTSPSISSSGSTSNKAPSIQQSLNETSEVQDMQPPPKQASLRESGDGSIPRTTPLQVPTRSYSEPPPQQGATTQQDFSAFVFNDNMNADAESTKNTLAPMQAEPGYKSKRPPPLAREQSLPLTKVRSPTAPQPSSAGVLSKGFGKLFGRRRSHSMISRREVARQALSDEPDVYDHQDAGQSILSARSDGSLSTAEPSPLLTPSMTSPIPVLSSHEESLQALEGMTAAPKSAPMVLIEPVIEEEPSEPIPSPQQVRVEPVQASSPIVVVPEPEPAQAVESLQRISIDSASSYGSVGFSDHGSSSRSSSPRTDSLMIKSFDSSHLKVDQLLNAEIPAPLRPGRAQTLPESPTDPLFQQGRLSPIPDHSHVPSQPIPPLQASQVESQPSLTPGLEPHAALVQKGNISTPNKGICRGCSQVILAAQKSVSSADGRLTGRYHKECFVCRTCQNAFPTAEFYVHDDQPYCAHHYHELENSLCATCGKGIEGLYMETANVAGRGKEKHHAECLKCTTCKIRLDHDYFELSGNVYCERDAFRIASMPKTRDNAPSRPSPLIREYISSGDRGLLGAKKFPERRTTRLMTMT